MKVVLGYVCVLVAALLSGPSVLTEAASDIIGGCTANATNVSSTLCKPSSQTCASLSYDACHTSTTLDKDIECQDDQLNHPCYVVGSTDCGSKKDADYDDCESS
jgi:hypothetical protein